MFCMRSSRVREVRLIEDMLWDMIVDGGPLRACIPWPPTRSPELNPIELVFHVISRAIRNWKNYEHVTSQTLRYEVNRACNNITLETVVHQCAVELVGFLLLRSRLDWLRSPSIVSSRSFVCLSASLCDWFPCLSWQRQIGMWPAHLVADVISG